MDLESFRTDLIETVRAAAEAGSMAIRRAFVEEAARRLADAEEAQDFVTCNCEGPDALPKKILVDGYAYDEVDGSVTLLVADWSDSDETQTLGTADVRKLFGMLRGFVDESLRGRLTDGSIEESSPTFDLALSLKDWMPDATRFRFFLASNRQLSSRIKDWSESPVGTVPTEFHIWDVSRFHRAFISATGRDDLTVDFTDDGASGLPCLKAGSATDYDAYLCVIPGDLLAKVYERYGSRLLEGNVRSFLSAKGKVNSRIQGTISAEPEMFFAYNNGIAATAAAVEVTSSTDGLRLLRATDLQIVNGGQTTASLALARRKGKADLSSISVQMKLSVVPAEKAVRLIPDIARYANSQNKVSDADFFANHPYHVRVEEISRRVWAPAALGAQHGTHWFYERARGQYLNEQTRLTRPQTAQFLLLNPRSQLILKTDIAKVENSWRRLPHKVSLGAQKNFSIFAEWIQKAWDEDSTQFSEDYFKQVVALTMLFRHVEGLVSRQPWYDNGYRAQTVTYTVARFAQAITDSSPDLELDHQLIWSRRAVPGEFDVDLAAISARVYEILTAPPAGVRNISEWAKREACWTRVSETAFSLSPASADLMLSRVEGRRRRRDAAATQKIDTGIGAQMAVVGIGGPEWRRMQKWGADAGLLSAKESQILALAAAIPLKLPTEKQSSVLLEIRSRLADAGYRSN
ncbi:MAG: hypothetical protein RJA99_3313 [Pseudomonadota bacterium]|jgi:hypothetical protein